MLTEDTITKISELCERFPKVKLLYLFGSQAKGAAGPLSDYDFSVYIAPEESSDPFLLPELGAALSKILSSDKIDICDLAKLDAPELAYEIINGELLYEVEPYKMLIEPFIMNIYFDFKMGLRNNFLTKD